MSEKHYPYYGGAYDRIVFDKDGSVWVPESEISKLRYLESENASLRGAAQGLGELCDDYKSENAKLRELVRRLLTEYRYMRVRPRRTYLGHEERMRAIEGEMSELGIEVE